MHMHLLYFVQYYPPENASGLTTIVDMVEGFASHGWKVDLYVPTPTRGVNKSVRKEYCRKRKEVSFGGNLTIHRMHLYREGKGFIGRAIRYFLFSLKCLFRGLFLKADAVFTGAAPPTQGLVAGLIGKLTKKKVIYNPQDLFPDSLVVAGKIKKTSLVAKICYRIERFAYKNCDRIITISEDMANTIKSRVLDFKKISVIRNWVDTNKFVYVPRGRNVLFKELELDPDLFYVLYAGNIGMLQSVGTILETAKLMTKEKKIHFVIFGNGSEKDNILKIISDCSLNNVSLFPLQPAEKSSEVYSIGDICLITCKKGTSSIGMPSKMWTIMSVSRPIIASFDVGGEMDKIISEEAHCGMCVEAENAEALASAILNLKNGDISSMGHNARRFAVNFASKDNAISDYIKVIEDMA